MTGVERLATCETLHDLYDLMSDSKLRTSRWGGWFFSHDAQGIFSENDIVHRLDTIYKLSIKNRASAETTLDIIGRINELNEQGRELVQSWYMILLTIIVHWLDHLRYQTDIVLNQIEFKAKMHLNKNEKQETHHVDEFDSVWDDKENKIDPVQTLIRTPIKKKSQSHAPEITRFTVDFNQTEIHPYHICQQVYYVKMLNGKHLTFSISDDQKMTVKDFLAFVSSKTQTPADSIKLFVDNAFIHSPLHHNVPLSAYKFFEERWGSIIVMPPDAKKEMDRMITQMKANVRVPYPSLDAFETSLFSLANLIETGDPSDFDQQFNDLKDFLSMIEALFDSPQTAQPIIDYLVQIRSFLTNLENLYDDGSDAIVKKQQMIFKEILEDRLTEYPAISCTPRSSKPTLQLIHKGSAMTFVFDKEALQSQLGNGEMSDFFINPSAKEIEIEVEKEVFVILCDYLQTGCLPKTIKSIDEKLLIKLYRNALNLIIPRLEIECAKEIYDRLMDSTWKQKAILDPYLELEGTLLGKMLKIHPL